MSEKPTLNIVLVEPRIPQNTGNVARTCACTACRLHLVGPMGFAIDDKKLKHAGLDYWHYLDINYYDGLEDFFARNKGPFYYFTTKAPQRYTDIQYPDGAYLVFGREDAGLPEALLAANQEHCIRMPMRSKSSKESIAELTPKKKGTNIDHIIIIINTTTWNPSSFKLYYSDRTYSIINLSKYATDQNFPDSTFVFNKKQYPKAELIDLR